MGSRPITIQCGPVMIGLCQGATDPPKVAFRSWKYNHRQIWGHLPSPGRVPAGAEQNHTTMQLAAQAAGEPECPGQRDATLYGSVCPGPVKGSQVPLLQEQPQLMGESEQSLE